MESVKVLVLKTLMLLVILMCRRSAKQEIYIILLSSRLAPATYLYDDLQRN